MTWSLGSFTERADPYRDMNVWNCAVLRNGKFVGSINFAVDRQTVVYEGLNDLPTIDLGGRVVAALGHHVGGLIATGKFPRADDFLLEVRITEEESQQVLRNAAPADRDYSLVVPTLDASIHSMMAIRSLTLEGLFGFGSTQTIELNNELTVAIGENGSGKSSIRKALSALRNLAGTGTQILLATRFV
jgi:AAA domain